MLDLLNFSDDELSSRLLEDSEERQRKQREDEERQHATQQESAEQEGQQVPVEVTFDGGRRLPVSMTPATVPASDEHHHDDHTHDAHDHAHDHAGCANVGPQQLADLFPGAGDVTRELIETCLKREQAGFEEQENAYDAWLDSHIAQTSYRYACNFPVEDSKNTMHVWLHPNRALAQDPNYLIVYEEDKDTGKITVHYGNNATFFIAFGPQRHDDGTFTGVQAIGASNGSHALLIGDKNNRLMERGHHSQDLKWLNAVYAQVNRQVNLDDIYSDEPRQPGDSAFVANDPSQLNQQPQRQRANTG